MLEVLTSDLNEVMFGQLTTSPSSVFQSDIAEGTKEDMNLVVLKKGCFRM